VAKRSTRDKYIVALAVPIAVVIALIVGPTDLNPLPIWVRLVIAGAGLCVIATIAVYRRRRAR
jgi:uncharacterized membrane protein